MEPGRPINEGGVGGCALGYLLFFVALGWHSLGPGHHLTGSLLVLFSYSPKRHIQKKKYLFILNLLLCHRWCNYCILCSGCRMADGGGQILGVWARDNPGKFVKLQHPHSWPWLIYIHM